MVAGGYATQLAAVAKLFVCTVIIEGGMNRSGKQSSTNAQDDAASLSEKIIATCCNLQPPTTALANLCHKLVRFQTLMAGKIISLGILTFS